jgi:hypothetical protein
MSETKIDSQPLGSSNRHRQRTSSSINVAMLFLLLTSSITQHQHLSSSPGVNTVKATICRSIDDSRIALLSKNADAKRDSIPEFGLVVAHCKEDYMDWVDGVENITLPGFRQQKTTWDTVIYEKCNQRTHQNYSTYQMNAGSEECSAYIKYIIDRYDDLPEVVYFLQPDALAYNEKKQKKAHTNFRSLQALVDASAPLLTTRQTEASNSSTNGESLGYLNLGITRPMRWLVSTPGGIYDNPAELIDLMKERGPSYDNTTELKFVPGACFAVRRERIWANPPDFYKDLQLAIFHNEDIRRMCWNLERTWHVVFGDSLLEPSHLEQ